MDALTLEPISLLIVGGRRHHGQVFRDRYRLMDTFARDPDGLDVFLLDPQTDEILDIIEMPGFGNPHGLVWVHYDEDGNGRVVRDQGGFHGGIDPYRGVMLDY